MEFRRVLLRSCCAHSFSFLLLPFLLKIPFCAFLNLKKDPSSRHQDTCIPLLAVVDKKQMGIALVDIVDHCSRLLLLLMLLALTGSSSNKSHNRKNRLEDSRVGKECVNTG